MLLVPEGGKTFSLTILNTGVKLKEGSTWSASGNLQGNVWATVESI